jgi:hypothetical protein
VVGGFDGQESLSTVDVTYARDARMDMWLPERMTERHEVVVRHPTPGQVAATAHRAVVTATASYSEFKRFEAASAIK